MFCSNCGFQNNQGDMFCKQCGRRLDNNAESRQQQNNQSNMVQQPMNNQQYQQPHQNLNNYPNNNSNTNYINKAVNPNMTKWAILSIILPIASIIWYWFIGLSFFIAIFLAAAGFSFAQKGQMANKKLAVIGKILNGILAGIAIIMYISGLIATFNK